MVKIKQGRSENNYQVRWTWEGGGGREGNTHTKPESVFLVHQVENSQSHEQLEFYLPSSEALGEVECVL